MQPQQEESQTNNVDPKCLPDNYGWHVRAVPVLRRAIGPLCLLTLCAILIAGLWPFRAPPNEVTWIEAENGVRFGAHGTLLSTSTFPISSKDDGGAIEIWIRPAKIWTTGAILVFYSAEKKREFSIIQDYADLLITTNAISVGAENGQEQLRVKDVFRDREAFITLTSDERKALVYVDGRLATVASSFALSGKDLSGQLIVANAPLRDWSWSGDLKGLAIYPRTLSSTEAQRHYQGWVVDGTPLPEKSAMPVAVYLFNEHSGKVVANVVSSATNLKIPERFALVDQLRFESPLSEFRHDRSYVKDAFINVLGFVPLGFVCGLYFGTVRQSRRAVLITVLIGAAISLAIEYFQSYLPTRFSGVTDIITNTAGTWIGVMLSNKVGLFAPRYWAEQFYVQPSKPLKSSVLLGSKSRLGDACR